MAMMLDTDPMTTHSDLVPILPRASGLWMNKSESLCHRVTE